MYGKIHRSMFYGSLSGQSDPQLVLVCLVAHSDRNGNVELPAHLIAPMTGLPLERVQAAIAVLEAPDDRSRTPEEQGRRLIPYGDGRWNIVNRKKYAEMRDEDDRRTQNREAKQRSRRQRKSANVSQSQPVSSQIEREIETEVKTETEKDTPLSPNGDVGGFEQVWKAYPHFEKRSSKKQSRAKWERLRPKPSLEAVLAAIEACKATRDWQKDGGSYVPGLQVWIEAQGWDSSSGAPNESETPQERMRRWKKEGIL